MFLSCCRTLNKICGIHSGLLVVMVQVSVHDGIWKIKNITEKISRWNLNPMRLFFQTLHQVPPSTWSVSCDNCREDTVVYTSLG